MKYNNISSCQSSAPALNNLRIEYLLYNLPTRVLSIFELTVEIFDSLRQKTQCIDFASMLYCFISYIQECFSFFYIKISNRSKNKTIHI